MTKSVNIRMRARPDIKLAFDQWLVTYRHKPGKIMAGPDDALEELLRMAGMMPENGGKGRVLP